MPQEHHVDLPMDLPACLELVAHAAETWGGGWQADGDHGGRLALPVMAGVRRGWVAGRVDVEPLGEGSRLHFRVEESEYHLETASVVTLVIAACGAVVTIIAPVFPVLIRFMPIGMMLTLAAWLFIVGRLRNSGPEEFLADLAEEMLGEEELGEEDDGITPPHEPL